MPAAVSSKKERVRTTVRLPRPLYDEARSYLGKDLSPADNINDFFVAAICNYVKLLRRKRIDAAFASIAEDADYQKEAKLIAEEFGQSDWEALEIGEKDPTEVGA
jgi:hypothetical protein